MVSNGATVELIIRDLPALGKLETAIELYLDEPASLTAMREKFGQEEELPVIQVDDEHPLFAYDDNEINVDDIPF